MENMQTDNRVVNSENSFSNAKKGKEIKVDTHLKEKLEKAKREERKRLARERKEQKKINEAASRKEKFQSEAVKEATKSENIVNAKISKAKANKDKKVDNAKLNQARERVLRAVRTPYTYYYYASKNVSNTPVFTNICQCLNDKFADRIYQPQYFAIAEQSDRIFDINGVLITHAIGVALSYPKERFVVQVSPKYLEKKERLDELELLLENVPSNLILCFDARTLVMAGSFGRSHLLPLVEKYQLQILIDNPETERLSILFDYPFKYLRLDNRYFVDRTENKKMFIRFLMDYCKKKNIDLCAKFIETKQDMEWMQTNGVRYLEGNYIQCAKKTVKAALEIKD